MYPVTPHLIKDNEKEKTNGTPKILIFNAPNPKFGPKICMGSMQKNGCQRYGL